VSYNLDFVGVYGYGPARDPITIDVVGDGVTLGTPTAQSVDTAQGPGLEVTLDPQGAPQPGDWSGTDLHVRPRDRILVANGGTVDEVTVDNIRYTGPPVEDPTTTRALRPVGRASAEATTSPSGSARRSP
jgi:hypothetical protein